MMSKIRKCDVPKCSNTINVEEVFGQVLYKRKGSQGAVQPAQDMCEDCIRKIFGWKF